MPKSSKTDIYGIYFNGLMPYTGVYSAFYNRCIYLKELAIIRTSGPMLSVLYFTATYVENTRDQLLQQKTIKQSHGKIYGTKFVTELRQFL
jgi:hypothetical protein